MFWDADLILVHELHETKLSQTAYLAFFSSLVIRHVQHTVSIVVNIQNKIYLIKRWQESAWVLMVD